MFIFQNVFSIGLSILLYFCLFVVGKSSYKLGVHLWIPSETTTTILHPIFGKGERPLHFCATCRPGHRLLFEKGKRRTSSFFIFPSNELYHNLPIHDIDDLHHMYDFIPPYLPTPFHDQDYHHGEACLPMDMVDVVQIVIMVDLVCRVFHLFIKDGWCDGERFRRLFNVPNHYSYRVCYDCSLYHQ